MTTETNGTPMEDIETAVQIAEDSSASQQPRVNQYTDGYAHEVPRQFLTLEQAAAVLGKSMRALERSLLGRWGNKLPDGWVARKIRTERGDEWRVLPPAGMRVKAPGTISDTSDGDVLEETNGGSSHVQDSWVQVLPVGQRRQVARRHRNEEDFQTAIVVDRSEEVENLLRELYSVQCALSEERRTHMEDLRMVAQLQGSMRLLEVNAAEQGKLKMELDITKHQLSDLQKRYEEIAGAPWWKRPFMKFHT